MITLLLVILTEIFPSVQKNMTFKSIYNKTKTKNIKSSVRSSQNYMKIHFILNKPCIGIVHSPEHRGHISESPMEHVRVQVVPLVQVMFFHIILIPDIVINYRWSAIHGTLRESGKKR